MTIESLALIWVERILGFAIFFQSLELLQLRRQWSEKGIWRWSLLRREFSVFPSALEKFFGFFLKENHFRWLLILRLLGATVLFIFPHPAILAFLWLSTVLISLRWRGAFNGGSDFMTLIILLALTIGALFSDFPQMEKACLWYIAIQSCTSYFLAGFAKLKSPGWRNGEALSGFLAHTIYGPQKLFQNPKQARLGSWMVLLFECSFPLCLMNPKICLPYLFFGVIFHFVNFLVFGLNRFFFVWIATYPALYYCSRFGF